MQNIFLKLALNSGILTAYTIGFTKELTPTKIASVLSIKKSDRKGMALLSQNLTSLNIIAGSQVRSDASVTIIKVAVSLRSLLFAPGTC